MAYRLRLSAPASYWGERKYKTIHIIENLLLILKSIFFFNLMEAQEVYRFVGVVPDAPENRSGADALGVGNGAMLLTVGVFR